MDVSKAHSEKLMPISGAEFRERGYLQEANRQFFHPLGLALALNSDSGLMVVIDGRADPEGFNFPCGMLDAAKAGAVILEAVGRARVRAAALGYNIQPIKE